MIVITVVGSGQMGSAMSFPARDNGHELRLAGTFLDDEIIEQAARTGYHKTLKRQLPDGVKYFYFSGLDDALDGADLIISGVSSFGVDWFADEIIPRLPRSAPVLSVTKGMFNFHGGSLLSYPGFYAKKYPDRRFYAVGGPCTSYELADRDQTHIAFCGNDARELSSLKKIFGTEYYHISATSDTEGLECAVAIKNAYALAVTLAVGLSNKKDGSQHYNSQAALFGQSVAEMRKLLALFGFGCDNIIYGAGDLYVTVFGGRTRMIGTLLGEGVPFGEAMAALKGVTLESVVIAKRTAEAVRELIKTGRANECDYPLLLHIDEIISRGAEVNIPWEKFTSNGIEPA